MHAHAPTITNAEQVRRQVSHDLYQKLAFVSFLIWTLGTLVLFILFAADRPNPIPATGMAMGLPLIPASLIWGLYRPLVRRGVAHRLRSTPDEPAATSSEPGSP
jgi:hypothetical protein